MKEVRRIAWDTLVEKYGLEGAKAEMRRRALLVKNRNRPWSNNPEKAREAQRLGVQSRLRKKNRDNRRIVL